MCDVQYWKSNNICNTWKIKKKLKSLDLQWLVFHYHYAKNFRTFQKRMLQSPGWIRKNVIPRNFSWRVCAEIWDASCFKKGLLEKQQCSKHLQHISIEKDKKFLTCPPAKTFLKFSKINSIFSHFSKKKSHKCEEGGAHLKISFWHLFMNFKKHEKSEFW